MLLGNLVNAKNEWVFTPLITKSRRSVLRCNVPIVFMCAGHDACVAALP